MGTSLVIAEPTLGFGGGVEGTESALREEIDRLTNIFAQEATASRLGISDSELLSGFGGQ
jgi:hypothetical protein